MKITPAVIPAQAGIHLPQPLDSGFRWSDGRGEASVP